MRAPITIVIPTLNAGETLPACLAALVEGIEAGLIRDLIVSDGGSRDATLAIARAWGAETISGPASRGGQLRRGCAGARGEWLMILHADTCLLPGWSQVVSAHLQGDAAGYFRLRFDRGGMPARFVAGWANLRSRLFGLPYGDQGLLISAARYAAVGGYPDQPLMEDVAIARHLRGHLVTLDAVAVTDAGKFLRQGWLRRGSRNFLTLLRYIGGADPEVLAERYRR